eukprot:CAMPEP_0196585118 /NCGR_PEP_ID=MMETSP1081-20130531/49572_1 /TAXON_ID=36882 /ORGANISM="Pyramimonas amylifera, Strain CCMP720" /LENGTH=105 /DNA_ID=CAMNT_0041906561 /DNA_START=166 /DNA_END=480 /DNA_ORIENTATION=+
MRITHSIGGSLTGARWVLALAAVAWGVRVLRARNILIDGQQGRDPSATAASRELAKGAARLSPLSTRLLVRTDPQPHLLVDVRDQQTANSKPLHKDLAAAVLIPE